MRGDTAIALTAPTDAMLRSAIRRDYFAYKEAKRKWEAEST